MAVADAQLAIADARTMVANTQMIVADIHQNVLTMQEGASGKDHSVGVLVIHQRQETHHILDSSQVSDAECSTVRSLMSP